MAYCTPAQLQQILDVRLIGDLLADTGVRVDPGAQLTNANLANALSIAAGQINSAALVGERYTVLELSNLTGDDAAFLTMLNAWLSFGILCSRRGRDAKEHSEYVQALETMEHLKTGSAIFNVAADVAVGVGSINFVSAQNYATVNSLRFATPYYYPVRRTQNPAPLGSN